MKNKMIIPVLLLIVVIAGITACIKDDQPLSANRPVVVSASWTEEFDDVSTLGGKGWIITNNSDKVGPEAWRQGRYELANKASFAYNAVIGFPAYSASKSPKDFVSCDFDAGSDTSNMSVWLISPITKMKNGDQIIFYSRSAIDTGSSFLKNNVDRLQVRGNITNSSTNAGRDWTSTGDFSALWLDINSSLSSSGYPSAWTKYTITLAGITGTVQSRFAFRYFVASGGPDGPNAGMVGIDSLAFVSK